MAENVRVIPVRNKRNKDKDRSNPQKRRVVGYARVSTDLDEQQQSFDAQVSYYKKYIKERNDWEYAGIYADEGITGTNAKNRPEFSRMVKDGMDGKFDLIITKSVSRFARNTVDSLNAVRKLKDNGVEIYFEKENIWTFDGKGELLITIMSSLAQEESRSISENTKWGKRKAMENGAFHMSTHNFLGYDRDGKGNLTINKEEEKTVKRIFELFLQGLSVRGIARELEKEGRTGPSGNTKWHKETVYRILKNEKYCGDVMLQKNFISDFLTKKKVRNKGELPRYYIEDHHPAIISREIFREVQAELKERSTEEYSGLNIFSSKLVCGICGTRCGRKTMNKGSRYEKECFHCNHKYTKEKCPAPTIYQEDIKKAFIEQFNKLLKNRDFLLEDLRELQDMLCDTSEYEKEDKESHDEMIMYRKEYMRVIDENSKRSISQQEYKEKEDRLFRKFEEAEKRYVNAHKLLEEKKDTAIRIKMKIEEIKRQPSFIEEFDERLWGQAVKKALVHKDGIKIEFRF